MFTTNPRPNFRFLPGEAWTFPIGHSWSVGFSPSEAEWPTAQKFPLKLIPLRHGYSMAIAECGMSVQAKKTHQKNPNENNQHQNH